MTSRRGGEISRRSDAVDKPRRPILVEIGAALLVVTGLMSLLGDVDLVLHARLPGGAEFLALVFFAVDALTVIAGVLARFGRGWLLAVNVAAIAGFLELTSGSAQGLLLGVLDVLVVVAFVRERAWFDEMRSISP
jgi:hypothetical protein